MKALLKARELKAFELAEQIGVSATSISKIMNGVTRPRQNTFTKLCQALCNTEEEERALVQAFLNSEKLDEDGEVPSESDKESLKLRAEQFLKRKTESIRFKKEVAAELDKARISYQQDYCEGDLSTDFLIEHDGKRIALECKSNLGRDLEKTETICALLAEQFLATVQIVVPYIEKESGQRQLLALVTSTSLTEFILAEKKCNAQN